MQRGGAGGCTSQTLFRSASVPPLQARSCCSNNTIRLFRLVAPSLCILAQPAHAQKSVLKKKKATVLTSENESQNETQNTEFVCMWLCDEF